MFASRVYIVASETYATEYALRKRDEKTMFSTRNDTSARDTDRDLSRDRMLSRGEEDVRSQREIIAP